MPWICLPDLQSPSLYLTSVRFKDVMRSEWMWASVHTETLLDDSVCRVYLQSYSETRSGETPGLRCKSFKVQKPDSSMLCCCHCGGDTVSAMTCVQYFYFSVLHLFLSVTYLLSAQTCPEHSFLRFSINAATHHLGCTLGDSLPIMHSSLDYRGPFHENTMLCF